MWFRRGSQALLIVSALLLCSSPAGAQSALGAGAVELHLDGRLSGTLELFDETGAPARHLEVSGAPRVALWPMVPPGRWQIRLTDASGKTTSLWVTIEPLSVARVRLSAANDGPAFHLIESLPLAEGQSFNRRWLEDHPAARDVWTLAEVSAPYLIADQTDTGGLRLGRPARVGVRGASWSSAGVHLNGLGPLEADRMGWIPFLGSAAANESVTVLDGRLPIEFMTPGSQLLVQPRLFAGRAQYTLDGSFSTERMVDRREYLGAPAIARLSSWAAVSGAVSRQVGSTGLFLAVDQARVQHYERALPELWSSRLTGLHLSATRPADGHQLVVTAGAQSFRAPYEERHQFRDRRLDERGLYLQTGAAWTRVNDTGHVLGLTAGVSHSSLTPETGSGIGGVADRVTEGRMPSPPWQPRLTRGTAGASWHLPVRTTGGLAHAVRGGVTGAWTHLSASADVFPVFGEAVNGLPARVWVPVIPGASMSRTTRHAGAYAADRIMVGSRLTIEAAGRVDWSSGSASGAAQDVSWLTFSPRLSFQWRMGPLAIFGASGRYVDSLTPHLLAHGDPAEPVFDVHLWHDRNANVVVDAGETGVRVSRQGRGAAVAAIDPDFRAPRAREHTAGLELALGRHLTFRGSAIWRRQWDLAGSINTGVTRADYDVRLIPDAAEDWDGPQDDRPLTVYARRAESFGHDAFLLTNPADGTAWWEGIETTWILRTSRVEMMFGATAHRSRSWAAYRGFGPLENDHSAAGEIFEDPNARPFAQGSHFFDRSYVGKWSGTVRAPGDIRLAWAARYQDGQPFARVVVVPDLPTGPEMIHAYRTARTRYTYALTLDVRLEKGFSVGSGRGAVRLDVYNATRHRNEVEEDATTSPAFRRSTAMQPPLTARLGLRFTW